jgi:hypothetical protein
MKKSLFFVAAASALMLTACSSENDVVQNAPQTQETVAKALDFDVYMPEAVTRAGDPAGVMTTDKLKTTGKGFGVFAYHHDNSTYAAGAIKPNFMYNEHVSWSGGWTYSPLKYWPNETDVDSQDPAAAATSNRVDRLSFFAYAPYVATGSGNILGTKGASDKITNSWHGTEASGIMAIQDETVTGDPKVEWKYSAELDNNVDLLWGVAPNGMDYTSVAGSTVDTYFGYPLKDLVKPDKDQKIKFLFQHALSRIGLSVVSAIDQIAAGDDGGVYNNAQTRVLVKSVTVYGSFGQQGVLNLNNTAEKTALWESVTQGSVDGAAMFTGTVANGYIAPDLRYVDSQISAVTGAGTAVTAATNFAKINTGVLSSEQTVLSGGADPSKKATDLTYAYDKVLYKLGTGADYVRATTKASEDVDAFTKDASGNYAQAYTSGSGGVVMNGTTRYFKIVKGDAINVSNAGDLTNGETYYVESGSAGSFEYTKYVADGTETSGTYYSPTITELSGSDYTGDCYTALMPRYFMVIPTGSTPIKVKINYAVVTYDNKLNTYISNIDNEITKQVSVNLESGKSYNLKLILGLTSVKLDATVADWQVGDDAEIWLPQNK